ncbi:3-hydroxyacyl-CoA dehydrogenase NAD-binding domain-containing protein [Streptomyces sp. HC307]|uniref:3-hydroxyacyl-CoA dehydrogenase NAD-binding domain-containing protein n=1 Tax=Streptomyces flavusporus TaxID=3385496 RepID=UPI003917362F
MTALDLSSPVAVVGTGTMGQGIAQVALVAGHSVRLYDAVPGRAREAADAIGARLDRLVEKDRLTGADRDAARARLLPAESLAELADCALVVEAVLERLDVKQELLRALEDVVAEDCLLATNTSSLSVTAIGGALRSPGRFVGLHFFNPAPLLPLVEVVSGFATDVTSATRAYETARAWGKSPVACADTPGFIVNRIARPFYAEAFAVYEAQGADPATIDAVLRESGGFRMGAFELTDLIGQDVNESVMHSVWQSFFQDVRFTPSLAQRRLVESGRLGRKSGQGWYAFVIGGERLRPHIAASTQLPAYAFRGSVAALGRASRHLGVNYRSLAAGGDRSARWHAPNGLGRTGRPLSHPGRRHGSCPWSEPGGRSPSRAGHMDAARGDGEALNHHSGGTGAPRAGTAPGVPDRTATLPRCLQIAASRKVDDHTIGRIQPRGCSRGHSRNPLGPFEWSRRLGRNWAYALLDDLHLRDPSGRYAPSLALYRHAYATDKREGSTS